MFEIFKEKLFKCDEVLNVKTESYGLSIYLDYDQTNMQCFALCLVATEKDKYFLTDMGKTKGLLDDYDINDKIISQNCGKFGLEYSDGLLVCEVKLNNIEEIIKNFYEFAKHIKI